MTPLSISHLPAGTPWWVFAAVVASLILHIGGGSVGILSGYGAVSVAKGERLHRAFGTVFVASMLTMAMMATGLAILNQQRSNTTGGILAFYLVSTAWMTVRRKEGTVGRFEYGALFAALCVGATLLIWGLQATVSPKGQLDGSAAALSYVFGSFALFAAALDLKVILHGGISGARRIARHLWRMCFAFFFGAASFFLGQQKVMPAFMHGSPLLFVPAFAPLVLMVFWLLRVRLTSWFTKPALAS
ncbi:MAG TPA: hypothetical protein VNX86_11030 [Rhizomicrobium sp.]|jgi:uncharacterized membrane protein|nr:hypothetical protein [Rhizomicrobium sp.]